MIVSIPAAPSGKQSVRENAWRPYGTRAFVPLHPALPCRASHSAATRLEFWWCLLHRLRSMVVLTQSQNSCRGCFTSLFLETKRQRCLIRRLLKPTQP
jgi:hypothetical protein